MEIKADKMKPCSICGDIPITVSVSIGNNTQYKYKKMCIKCLTGGHCRLTNYFVSEHDAENEWNNNLLLSGQNN